MLVSSMHYIKLIVHLISLFNICAKFCTTCTGPKPEEVSIFWQMIWEQKPTVVVMLTNVKENGKVELQYVTLCI